MNNKKLLTYTILIILSGILVCLLAIGPHEKEPPELIIYDVHPESPRIVKDDGTIEFSDYVRIKNLTDHSYDLSDLGLSDTKKNPNKLPLDGVIIEAGGSVMIKLDPSWNFALKHSGNETVYLTDSKGNILYRYTPDLKPEKPKLSADSGFYDDEFTLSMSAEEKYTIVYTLDGSEPGEDSEVYTGPIHIYDRSAEPNSVVNVPNTVRNYLEDEVEGRIIEKPVEEPVDKAFIVRAAAMDEYGNKSDVVTREYFFCGDMYKNIISVVADPDDLFGDEGIASVGREYDEWYLNGMEGDPPAVNYEKKGRDWEVPADMAYFRGHEEVLCQKCGLRVQGRTTRDQRVKNFQLRARDSYSGSDVFDYDFFENEEYRADAVTLDDSFAEAFFLGLVADEDIIKPKTTDRAALFINGEFWNDVYIKQKINRQYFADRFGTKEDNLIVYKETLPEIGGEDDESWNADRQLYLDIDEFIEENDISDESGYRVLCDMIDIDTYIDYLAINTWCGNDDWGEYENDMCWRVRVPDDTMYGDGRLRWTLHDADDIFDKDSMYAKDNDNLRDSVLYNGLMSNTGFADRYAKRIEELGNTTFSEESVNKELSKDKWDEPEKTQIAAFFEERRKQMDIPAITGR